MTLDSKLTLFQLDLTYLIHQDAHRGTKAHKHVNVRLDETGYRSTLFDGKCIGVPKHANVECISLLLQLWTTLVEEILYTSGIYPKAAFAEKIVFGTLAHHVVHPGLKQYIDRALEGAKVCLQQNILEAIQIVFFAAAPLVSLSQEDMSPPEDLETYVIKPLFVLGISDTMPRGIPNPVQAHPLLLERTLRAVLLKVQGSGTIASRHPDHAKEDNDAFAFEIRLKTPYLAERQAPFDLKTPTAEPSTFGQAPSKVAESSASPFSEWLLLDDTHRTRQPAAKDDATPQSDTTLLSSNEAKESGGPKEKMKRIEPLKDMNLDIFAVSSASLCKRKWTHAQSITRCPFTRRPWLDHALISTSKAPIHTLYD